MPTPDDVIPETEMNRRRRAHELAASVGVTLAGVLKDLNEVVKDLDMTPEAFSALMSETASPEVVRYFEEMFLRDPSHAVSGLGLGISPEIQEEIVRILRAKLTATPPAYPVEVELDRLLAEAPPLTDASGNPVPDQRPAIEAALVLRCGQSFQGSVSRADSGAVKLLARGPDPSGRPGANAMAFVEHFFDVLDIQAIAVLRPIAVEQKPKIWGA